MKNNPFKRFLAMALCLCMLVGLYVPSVSAEAPVSYHDMSMSQLLGLDEDLTWVFTGDSITHNGSWTGGYNDYAAWFEQYLYDIGRGDDTLINTAWGGANMSHFQPGRTGSDGMGLEQFVTKYNPDVVFIKLGMNNRGTSNADFIRMYKAMLDEIYVQCEKNGKIPKIILLSPTPLSSESDISSGENGSGITREDYMGSVKRFSISIGGIAEEYGLEFVDLRQAMVDESAVLGDRYHYTFFSDPSDGQIHPNGAGQYFMFKTICKELGLYNETMPIFQVSYDDINDAALYGDNTIISNYAGEYGANQSATNKPAGDPEMDKLMPELKVEQEQDGELRAGLELLASIDFTSQNGTFVGGSTYDGATRVDLTDANVMDDPLTLAEVQSLEREYTLIFRAQLDSTTNKENQPILWLSNNNNSWNDSFALGAQGKSDQFYYNIRKGSTTQMNWNGGTSKIDSYKNAVSGAWHTIAYVQKTTGLEYYVDGKLVNATLNYYIKEGATIGEVFANTTTLYAHIGSYGTNAPTYQLKGKFDYYQLYKGALTIDEIQQLTANGGPDVDNNAEMNKTIPTVSGLTPLASVDFNSTTGVFAGTSAYTTSTQWDLTDAEKMDDALTLDEAKTLDREFSIVFRARLDGGTHQIHQPVLMLTPGDGANWNNAISVGVPGRNNILYYETRQGGSEITSSTNTITLGNGVHAVLGEWHTIAIVQRTDGLDYYIDGTLAKSFAYQLNEGKSFGALFADATQVTAHIGSFCSGSAASYNLKADLDYYQFYGSALTAEQVQGFGNGAVITANDQPNSTMPQLPAAETVKAPELLASVNFTSENGALDFGNKAGIRIDTATEGYDINPLTQAEAVTLENAFSVVFRAKLSSTYNTNQPVLFISADGTANWQKALVLGVPATSNQGYFNVFNGTAGKSAQLNYSGTTINGDDQYHTVVYTYDNGTITYYVDGAQVGQHTGLVLYDPYTTIGSLFANSENFAVQIGRYGTEKDGTSYKLKGDFDFWQFYSGALSADDAKYLADNSGKDDHQAQMNKTMPTISGAKPLASVDFNSTTGVFAGTDAYATSTQWDLTDAEKMDDALTLDEAKGLDREFTIVLRGRLDSMPHQIHQALLMMTPGNGADWNNAISVGGPGKNNMLYYETRQGGKEVTSSTNTITLAETTQKVTDEWHTIAIVQRTNGLDYYIDGVLVQSFAYKLNDGKTFGSVFADATEITAHIGSFCSGSAATYNLKAKLDYYQFYGSALSGNQIRELSGVPVVAANWTDTVAANNLWAVVGADQMSGYLGATPNFSLFRLLNNGMRGGANEVGSYRDIRMMNLAKPGQTVSDVVTNYDEILGEHNYDVLMVLPEVPDVHAADYVHSADKVAAYKANILTLIQKNEGKSIVLWSPLASNDATINGYINDYANAVREIVAADASVLFFDANKFMNEHMDQLGTNWFDDSMNISPLCATDVVYAFFIQANYPTYTSGTSQKDPTNKGELKAHNLRYSKDARLYKSGVIKENLSYEVSVNGGSLTVDASGIAAQGYTNLRVASIPAIGIGSVINPWILGNVGESLEAPHSNPCITVYGEKDGVTYRFKDVQVTLTTSNNYTEPYFETDDLTALEVVGAPAIGFDPSKTTYDVEVHQYQRYVRIRAEGGSNLTIKVNGETVKSGEFSQYIAVDKTATATVTVTGGAQDKTYTLNLTRSDYADIIITEVMSDGYDGYTNKGADNYELIEIYNASGEDLNLLDYSIGYIRDYPYENEKGGDDQTPYYFTGNDQKFNKQSYLGINQITKYSSYWADKVDQEPEEVIFPADSTMVIWVKFSKDSGTEYGASLTYETLIAALEAHSGTHTLTVEVEENGETVTKTIVPNQDQLVVAEIPYGAAQSNVTQNINTTAENFYMDNFSVQQSSNSENRRGWLFVLDDSAVADYYGALTEAGDDIISAAKYVRAGAYNKLSNVMYYDVERGMSVVKNAGYWDADNFAGHTSDQQGYANLTSFGAVEYWQKPYDLADTTAAVIANNTPAKVLSGGDVTIELAITDDQDIRYVEMYVDADNDGTYETVVKKDITLITSATNGGKATDVQSYELTYTLADVQSDVSYYGFVLDGNNNKTELAVTTITMSNCDEHAYDDGVVTKDPTYNEDGEMTYTCTVCGHSYTEAIDALTAMAEVNGEKYATLEDAVKNANGNVITLLTDAIDSVTIAANVTIDLAGLTLKNVTVSDGYALTIIDTENDDYAGNGYAEVNGTVNTYATVNGKDYIVLNNEGQLTAHCFDVVISHISLDPAKDALGYKATVLGDQAVQSAVTGYGVDMSVSGGKVVTVDKDTAPNNGQFSLRLKNIMKYNGGEMPINAVAFVKFGEQTIKSDEQTTTMKDTMLLVNALTTLTDAQKEIVGKYYDDYSAVMAAWFAEVENNIDSWN